MKKVICSLFIIFLSFSMVISSMATKRLISLNRGGIKIETLVDIRDHSYFNAWSYANIEAENDTLSKINSSGDFEDDIKLG